MWVEFVVDSCPCSEGFSPVSPVFLPPQKLAFLNSNSIGNSRATGLSVEDCCVPPSLHKVDLLIYLVINVKVQLADSLGCGFPSYTWLLVIEGLCPSLKAQNYN